MKVDKVSAGKYIVAVSGGVDSVALLDIVMQQKNLDLVVAHYDHGIRDDSASDRNFVEELALRYDVPFEYGEGKLGAGASEEKARQARYEFLRSVKIKHEATAIITAHHQDDVIETILINLIRGTRRRGLSSLASTDDICRPLLRVSKADLKSYAVKNNLQWREDPTNQDPKYLRNWIRLNIMPKLSAAQRNELLQANQTASKVNQELEEILQTSFGTNHAQLKKSMIVDSPHDIATEVMADWLRHNNIRDFDTPTIERLVIGVKTLANGKTIEIKNNAKLVVAKDYLKINT